MGVFKLLFYHEPNKAVYHGKVEVQCVAIEMSLYLHICLKHTQQWVCPTGVISRILSRKLTPLTASVSKENLFKRVNCGT